MVELDYKEEWILKGKTCNVIIVRWGWQMDTGFHNVWNLYVVLFKKHPLHHLFKRVTSKNYMSQKIVSSIQMHGGVTYFERLRPSGSIKIGCDYAHYQDDRFMHYATLSEAYEVHNDARALFDLLDREVPVQEELAAPPTPYIVTSATS